MSAEVEFLSKICPADMEKHVVVTVTVYQRSRIVGSHMDERACQKCGLRDTFIRETTE